MAKVKTEIIHRLDLDNTGIKWITLAHKERAYINCHQQFAKITKPDVLSPRVQMLSGPKKDVEVKVHWDWIKEKKDKIPCDCPLLVVLNRGCQNMGIHE